MPVYWSILIMTLIIGVLSAYSSQEIRIIEGNEVYRIRKGFVFFVALYIVFFIGLRDRVLDTGAYINSFKEMPTTINGIIQYVMSASTGKGFYLVEGLFKKLLSQNYYWWLIFLAAVSCGCLFKILYRYSVDFPLSAYLFIAGTSFTWLLNGTRQFLVVCILFACTDWLLEEKKARYIVLALLLTTIHTSSLFIAIVVLFITHEKILPRRMLFFIVLTVVGTYFSEQVLSFIGSNLDKDYSQELVSGSGSNILRLLVAVVPLFIVLLNYKNVKEIAPPSIRLAINMSMAGVCFYFASTFTNGILVGRMPIYFIVYNLYLLPWLIDNCFAENSGRIAKALCMIFYFVYFYYQMMVAWNGLMYVSYILGISF